MSIILNSFHPSTQILLNSKYATKLINNMTSDCVFSFTSQLTKPPKYQMLISLISMSIPHSYYNINENNNTLIYTVNSITYTLTFTKKNYNISDFTTYLNSIMTGFVITYDSNTNKFTFYNSTYSTFNISSSSTCLTLLGLSSVLSTTINYLYSDTGVDLSYTKSIYVNVNLNLNTIDSRNNLSYNNVLTQIPVEMNYLGIETYKNLNNISYILNETKITNLEIFLTDDNDDVIDLNNCNWDCTILINYLFNEEFDKTIPNELLPNTNINQN